MSTGEVASTGEAPVEPRCVVEIGEDVDPFEPGTCDAYSRHLDSPASVSVVLRNRTSKPLLVPDDLGGCRHDPRFFEGSGSVFGHDVTTPKSTCPAQWTLPAAEACIERLRPQEAGCLACGWLPAWIRLEPGAEFQQAWTPVFVTSVELPPRL